MDLNDREIKYYDSLYEDYMSMLLLRQYIIFYGKLPNYDNCDMFGLDGYEILKVQFMKDLLNRYDAFKGSDESNLSGPIRQWIMWKEEIDNDKNQIYKYLETMPLPNGYIDDVTIHASCLLRSQLETKVRRDIKVFCSITDEDIADLEACKYIDNYFKLLVKIFYLRDSNTIDNICKNFNKESEIYFNNNSLFDKLFNRNSKKINFEYNKEDIQEIDKFYTDKLGLKTNTKSSENEDIFIERLNCLERGAENLVYINPSEFKGIILNTNELIHGTPERAEYKRLVKRKKNNVEYGIMGSYTIF